MLALTVTTRQMLSLFLAKGKAGGQNASALAISASAFDIADTAS
jgi:hypothetical protein